MAFQPDFLDGQGWAPDLHAHGRVRLQKPRVGAQAVRELAKDAVECDVNWRSARGRFKVFAAPRVQPLDPPLRHRGKSQHSRHVPKERQGSHGLAANEAHSLGVALCPRRAHSERQPVRRTSCARLAGPQGQGARHARTRLRLIPVAHAEEDPRELAPVPQLDRQVELEVLPGAREVR
eukprot:9085818-Alexandrium_andersonii.AAC.1